MKAFRLLFCYCIIAFSLFGCSDVNCPLTSGVYARWTFYKADELLKLTDTLNIYLKVNGQDTLLANRLYNVSSVDLPMSYYNSSDTLTLEIKTANHHTYKDMIIVKKENVPHFNSPECGTWVEHYVSDVQLTHNDLDSISVSNRKVDNNEVENFRIYFK